MIKWFKDLEITPGSCKCHLVLSESDITNINVDNFTVKSTKSQKLLGVTFNNKTNFQSHIENVFFKVSRKLNV